MSKAACRGMTEYFFSPQEDDDNIRSERGRRERVAIARKVCASCSVREACLDWAMRVKDTESIAGGFTAKERKAMRRLPHMP